MERFLHENRERFPKPLRGLTAITTMQFTKGRLKVVADINLRTV
jgi:hypothetical protein